MIKTPVLNKNRVSVAGTTVIGNRLYEEYLSSLQTAKLSYTIYDKMARSDSQVKRTLRAMISPIMAGKFEYIVTDITDSESVKQALFKNRFFHEYPMYSWQQMLGEILTMLKGGFSIFEPTYKVVNDPDLGKIVTLRNLGYLKQSTIFEWHIKNNEITSVRQIAMDTTGMSRDVIIKGQDLLVFTFDREGDNFEGVSVLRAAYGNYIRKDLFNKIDMIGIEKMAIGTPVWFAPNSVLDSPTELAKLQTIAENYVGHEQAYLILSDAFRDKGQGKGFEIIAGQYNADAVNQAIKREDGAIVDSVLASFLNIGTSRAGGNAQNEGQMNMFLESLTYIAKDVADTLDWVAHIAYVNNFGEPKNRLKMQVTNITKDDAEKAMTVLRGYITCGTIKADDRLETYIREKLDLPVADTATSRDFKGTPDYKADQPKEDQNNPTEQTNPEQQ